MKTFKLIVGLGNPGAEFSNTYHNVGFLIIDDWAGSDGFKKYKGLFEYAKKDVVLAKSLEFMNESGRAVKEAAHMVGAASKEILVIHDESDLPVGEWKLSLGGSSAGHKGIQSVIDHLGSNDFWRARIGIRQAQEQKRKKAEEFVLSQIRSEDLASLMNVFKKIEAEVNENY